MFGRGASGIGDRFRLIIYTFRVTRLLQPVSVRLLMMSTRVCGRLFPLRLKLPKGPLHSERMSEMGSGYGRECAEVRVGGGLVFGRSF